MAVGRRGRGGGGEGVGVARGGMRPDAPLAHPRKAPTLVKPRDTVLAFLPPRPTRNWVALMSLPAVRTGWGGEGGREGAEASASVSRASGRRCALATNH